MSLLSRRLRLAAAQERVTAQGDRPCVGLGLLVVVTLLGLVSAALGYRENGAWGEMQLAAVLVEESHGADLLVVGSRGHGGFAQLLLGSGGALALHRHDPVFIALQASSLTSTAVIVFLAHRYRGMVCEAHAHLRPDAIPRPGTADDRDAVIAAGTRP